jgi:hypothetical protein
VLYIDCFLTFSCPTDVSQAGVLLRQAKEYKKHVAKETREEVKIVEEQ